MSSPSEASKSSSTSAPIVGVGPNTLSAPRLSDDHSANSEVAPFSNGDAMAESPLGAKTVENREGPIPTTNKGSDTHASNVGNEESVNRNDIGSAALFRGIMDNMK